MIPLKVGKALNLSQYTAKAWAGGGSFNSYDIHGMQP